MYDTNCFFRRARLRSSDYGDVVVEILLFKSGRFLLRKRDRLSRLSGIGDWSYADRELTLDIWGKRIVYDLAKEDPSIGAPCFQWSSHSAASPVDGLDLRQVAGRQFV
jgi:hypothetical protein